MLKLFFNLLINSYVKSFRNLPNHRDYKKLIYSNTPTACDDLLGSTTADDSNHQHDNEFLLSIYEKNKLL